MIESPPNRMKEWVAVTGKVRAMLVEKYCAWISQGGPFSLVEEPAATVIRSPFGRAVIYREPSAQEQDDGRVCITFDVYANWRSEL